MGWTRKGNWMVNDTPATGLPSNLQWKNPMGRGSNTFADYNGQTYMRGTDGVPYQVNFSDDPSWLETYVLPVAAAYLGGTAIGAMAGGGAAAGAAGAGAEGTGGLASIAASAPEAGVGAGLGAGATEVGTAGLAGLGGDAAASGLGGMAIDSSIPAVFVHGGTGVTATGAGLGSYVGGAGALMGADQLTNNLSTNVGDLPDINPTIGESDLPDWAMPTPNAMPPITNADVTGGGTSSSMPTINWDSLLKNGSGLLNNLGGIAGAYTDYHKNTADQQYYQGLLDQMTHMYAPGSPEANLLKQQMDAKDAAAGRNSQYGVRMMNLAGTLAQQRANIMTSPAFVNLAEASRGHYDNSLNGLFAMLGQGAGNNSSGNGGGGGLSNLSGILNNGSNIIKGIGSLSSIFGG